MLQKCSSHRLHWVRVPSILFLSWAICACVISSATNPSHQFSFHSHTHRPAFTSIHICCHYRTHTIFPIGCSLCFVSLAVAYYLRFSNIVMVIPLISYLNLYPTTRGLILFHLPNSVSPVLFNLLACFPSTFTGTRCSNLISMDHPTHLHIEYLDYYNCMYIHPYDTIRYDTLDGLGTSRRKRG